MEKKLLTYLTNEQINEVSDYLRGSCNSLDKGLATIELTFEQIHLDSFANLDSKIFLCDECGWWHDDSENTGDSICDDCREDMLDMEDDADEDGELIDYPPDQEDENPCKVCGIFIEAGEFFVWSRRNAGVFYHQSCFDTFKPIENVNEKGEVEIVTSVAKADLKSDTDKHESFGLLLALCKAHSQQTPVNIWMTGAAGSGKTKASEQVAIEMSLPFYFIGAISEPYSLLGYNDANGKYVRTLFREAYENGGIFLMDEIDGSSPNALLVFNAALANGYCAFPDKIVARHQDCIVIAAANTFGLGGTSDYVGRVKLDAATLSRFVWLDWKYDEKLERKLAKNDDWFERVLSVRNKAKRLGLKILITPRATYTGASLLKSGIDQELVEKMVIKQGMTDEQWEQIK